MRLGQLSLWMHQGTAVRVQSGERPALLAWSPVAVAVNRSHGRALRRRQQCQQRFLQRLLQQLHAAAGHPRPSVGATGLDSSAHVTYAREFLLVPKFKRHDRNTHGFHRTTAGSCVHSWSLDAGGRLQRGRSASSRRETSGRGETVSQRFRCSDGGPDRSLKIEVFSPALSPVGRLAAARCALATSLGSWNPVSLKEEFFSQMAKHRRKAAPPRRFPGRRRGPSQLFDRFLLCDVGMFPRHRVVSYENESKQ
mmetsp:Transcript_17849/g.54575  ORF Transcript_17849/g.54575 Transcript_17849/m.54575 type:complete len:252 (-) Transcript_17849:1875-2630(-)